MALTDCQVMEVERGGGPGELWSEREREGGRGRGEDKEGENRMARCVCVCVYVSMYTRAKRSMRWHMKFP